MRHMLMVAATIGALLLASSPAAAQIADIDYYGFGWETGGLPPSNAGDVLIFTGVGNYADPVYGLDLSAIEVTFYVYDLVSTGQIPVGGGTIQIGYSGGTLEIWGDPAKNADWGVFPPNATAPSTFSDGTLLFRGSFQSFTLFLTAGGAGAYEGSLDGLSGEFISSPCPDCAYTWGGAFTPTAGAQVPDGYDVQIDGVFELDRVVGTTQSGWGQLKALYGN